MRLAIISDTHLAPGAPAFDANLAAIRGWIAQAGIETTIHLGDVSADGAKMPEQLAHAHARLADWPGCLHVLPGNHDIGDNPGESGHASVDADRLGAYCELFGADRWIITAAGWNLIGLNAQLFGRGDDLEATQGRWLEAAVAGLAGPTGLFLHKPLFRASLDDGDRHHRYLPEVARAPLLQRFTAADLRFVAAGHTHQTRQFHTNGIAHVWAPSAAFTLPDVAQETIGVKEVGAMLLTLDGDRHRFERVVPPGLVQHDLADHADLYPAHAGALRAIAHGRS